MVPTWYRLDAVIELPRVCVFTDLTWKGNHFRRKTILFWLYYQDGFTVAVVNKPH